MYIIMVSFHAAPEQERGEKSKNSGNVTLRRNTRGASRRRQEAEPGGAAAGSTRREASQVLIDCMVMNI